MGRLTGPRARFLLACLGVLAVEGLLGAAAGYGMALTFDAETAMIMSLMVGMAIGYCGSTLAWMWFLEDMFYDGWPRRW